MDRKKLRNNTVLMRMIALEGRPADQALIYRSLDSNDLGRSHPYTSMTNDATMDENKVFCKIARKRPRKSAMRVVSHQENHRFGITPQALDKFLVVNLCLGHIQSPICGGCVIMFRDMFRGCISLRVRKTKDVFGQSQRTIAGEILFLDSVLRRRI
jgi:hypothetical protein